MSAVARSLGRGVVALVLASTALCFLAPTASAHAFLVRSDPDAGATLAAGPDAVRLWFSEEVSRDLSSARLVDGDGRTVDGARLTTAGDDLRSLDVKMPPLERGSYGVLWRVFDEDDGHTTSGVLVFHVGEASRSAVFEDARLGSSDPPLDVALHWLAFCSLAGIIGALGVGGFVIGRAQRGDPGSLLGDAFHAAKRRLMLLGAASAGAGTLVGLGVLVAEARRLGPPGSGGSLSSTITALLGTRWGILWLVREYALVAAGALILVTVTRSAVRAGSRRLLWAALAGAAVAAVATQALGSHAASFDSGRATAIVADGVHLLTACLWLGSLPALLLLLWPTYPGVGRGTLVLACRTPFSWLAGTSVCLVAATGLYSAGRQVERIEAVTSTSYGRTLLVKTLIVGAVAVLGLINAMRLRGWRPGRELGARSPSLSLIAVESGLGIVLLLVASVLIGNPPARGPGLAASAASSTRTVYGSVDDLVVSVTVSPNRPGVNGFTLVVASSRRPPPAPVADVALELERGGRIVVVTVQAVEAGTYFGTGTFDAAGRWKLTAFIRRAGRTSMARVHLSVPASTSPVVAARTGSRLAPLADGLALIVLAAGIVLAVTARRRATGSRTGRGRAVEAQALPHRDGVAHEPAREHDSLHALTGSGARSTEGGP